MHLGQQGTPTCCCPPLVGSRWCAGLGCSCLIVLDRQDSPTCCWLSSSCLKGPTGPSGPCVPLVSWLSLAGALCPPGFGLCTPGLLGPSLARGSSGDSMIPAHPPARRLAAARALASRQWSGRVALPPPFAGAPNAPPCGTVADGTSPSGSIPGGCTCRHTWSRASSLCFRAARTACFSSETFHNSTAHCLRSAAWPAAQVAATRSSSGVIPWRCARSPSGTSSFFPLWWF